jgi:two-component system chemotaxis response regulator CheB
VSLADGGDEVYVPGLNRLLASAAPIFGPRLTAVILKGMGRDGADGVTAVRKHG